jgi:MFS family permease
VGSLVGTAERRLVLVIGAVVFVDTMFYAAIAPLLPRLANDLHLSKLSAGLMTASYPVGTLVGALPGGVLAARAGPKFTVCFGLGLLACSTLAFGLLNDAALLDGARFVEGVGGACSWAGGLAWIIAGAAPERRGALIGSALATAIGGALLGPVIGTVASALGRAITFTAVVVVAVLLIDQARRLASPATGSGQGLSHLARAARDRPIGVAMWLVALPAMAAGLVNVLGPLRLHRFGAGPAAIGATFLAATAIEAAMSRGSGSSRTGAVGSCPCGSGLPAPPVRCCASRCHRVHCPSRSSWWRSSRRSRPSGLLRWRCSPTRPRGEASTRPWPPR